MIGGKMEEKIKITLRTATRDRQAALQVTEDVTVKELLNSAKETWNLSESYEYVMRCERLGKQLSENSSLAELGIKAEDVLEIQPLADAGNQSIRTWKI